MNHQLTSNSLKSKEIPRWGTNGLCPAQRERRKRDANKRRRRSVSERSELVLYGSTEG